MPTKSLRRVCAGFRRRPPRTASAKSGAGPEPPPRSADPASGSLASSMPRKQLEAALTYEYFPDPRPFAITPQLKICEVT